MKKTDILKRIDHTLLSADASWDEIHNLCDEAVKFNTASVCVPQSYVKRIKDNYKDSLKICTVVGFPLGYNSTESKLKETECALENGADEIDMVINITDVKNKYFSKVENEIKNIKKMIGEKILKVIVETAYLEEEEKIKLCEVVTISGADYIKTSTGFAKNGATRDDIKLFKKYIGKNVKIKAAGGISSIEDLKDFIELGCSRLGTSKGIKLLENEGEDI
ncbi:deoxyribose-phosphate aldolase [Peptostreptococcus faecalis]|uniref:deoxyribose-phosphate aldolase n=1 Tax=Peptostreptococcus faecalis TaxID=2045015 RepID=UPI000C7DE4C6|nr:deoxyribose-phosphate aldolase [Peptostreptococcus faecalis]